MVSLVYGRGVHCVGRKHERGVRREVCSNVPIFLVLMYDHLKRLMYKLIAVNAEKRMTALRPIFFRSSCSGSDAQFRKVTTSFAICDVVAGVPRIQRFSSRKKRRAWSHTVIVFDEAIEEYTCHGDGVTREVRVVVHAVTNFESSRRVSVTSQQREDVVLSHQGQFRTMST